MALTDVFEDSQYRALSEEVLRSACESTHITVGGVQFEKQGYDDDYAWLCLIVDPRASDRAARNSHSSAADHFALIDPNGFSKNAGTKVDLTVSELEVADEASIQIRDGDGTPVLRSPWLEHLAVLRILFNTTTVH